MNQPSSPEAAPHACGICGGASDLAITATERMFGLGGEFIYQRCGSCGCVQLENVPDNLQEYYGSPYYAFAEPARPSFARRAFVRTRDALLFGRARWLGALLAPLVPRRMVEVREWFTLTEVTRSSRILDVGCGAGLLLRRLADEGFDRVHGIDPFIPTDIEYGNRVLVRKGTLNDITGPFDLIMFHHSLEHIPDQAPVMQRAADLLSPDGWCLIRIPTVSSAAWDEYRDRWVQLDAPRHLYLHSVESVQRLARTAGLKLERVVYDSTSFQFEGSELYRRDATLQQLNGAAFTARDRRDFERKARRLNALNRGDQAAFYLRKAEHGT